MAKQIKMVCNCCGTEKPLGEFYASKSYINKHTGKLSVCKDCIFSYVSTSENEYNQSNLIDILQMIDRPFKQSLLDSSIEEVNKSIMKKNVFRIYMKNLSMKEQLPLRWLDSSFENNEIDIVKVPQGASSTPVEIESDFVLDADIIRYWGKGYLDWEYEFLEDERIKLMSSFECPDYGMEMIMKDICFINLDIEKIRQERKSNNSKEITTLIDTRRDLMNDANMKPIQSTGAEGNDQITFGTLIKKWENERPVPQPLEDEMKEYIDTFMVGHLAKMEGLSNELTEKYDKALAKHTINFSDINREQEDFED